MQDFIDREMWLPKGEVGISVWRLQHGDVDYNEGRYFVVYPLPVDWLRGNNIIDDEHLWAAMQIRALHQAAFAKVGFSKMQDALRDSGGGWLKQMDVDPMLAFKAVMHPLLKWQQHLIGRLAWEELSPRDHGWVRAQRDNIRTSFDNLHNSLECFREMMQNDKDSAPIVAPVLHLVK
mgnify:CR=1 FL=1